MHILVDLGDDKKYQSNTSASCIQPEYAFNPGRTVMHILVDLGDDKKSQSPDQPENGKQKDPGFVPQPGQAYKNNKEM